MVRKDTSLGDKLQNILVTMHLLNYKETFVGTSIYIRHVVISIFLFTSMLSIELHGLKQFNSFLGYFFEYLPLFIPYRFEI